jgi:PAS domain S-box-containing protein
VGRELKEAQNRAEHRTAQEDLRVQRDLLRLVIDTNPNLIFVKDWDGRFILANQAVADLYDTTVGHLSGRTEADFQRDPGDVERSREEDRDIMTTGEARMIPDEAVLDVRRGTVRWFAMRKVPLVVPDGSSRQLLGIGTDITERKLAEEALRATEDQFRHAQKMEAIGQLAGGIAHDFNNLLTAILGFSELVLDRVRDQPDLAADMEEIGRAGNRATLLTRQLLAFSRKQVLTPQILDLNTLVVELEKMLRRVIGEDITFRTILSSSACRVKADPGQIEQVLMNLAVNARDAMPCGGTLTIESAHAVPPTGLARQQSETQAESYVALTIRDTGDGMPAEVRARIFEPFFTTKGPGKGTGLGLSTVYGIVAQSGGVITVDSELGRGTTFTVYLPAVEEALASITTGPAHHIKGIGTETVLLVEDEASVRGLVRRVLIQYGYTVLESQDGLEALTIAERHPGPIHLLLSDIVMPGLSGPALAQQLVAARHGVRVLLMSGFANRMGFEIGLHGANTSFVQKPFTPEGLAMKVRECLDRANAPRPPPPGVQGPHQSG